MRNPGATYRKLREVKYFHLVVLYKKLSKRIPCNCRYNYCYKFIGDGGVEKEIRLCLLHQDNLDLKNGVIPHLVDVCEEQHHIRNCNGFVLKHTKDTIKNIFEEELGNKNIKEKKYPDICALEWVLERSAVGLPPFTWIQELFYKLKNLIITRNKVL
jgi:hypothetical protein